MSKQRQQLLTLAALLVVVSLPPLLAVAQNQPPPAEAVKEQPQKGSQDAETDSSSDPQDTRQVRDQAGPDAGVTATQLKQFKPTDEIGADSAVSFPVDI